MVDETTTVTSPAGPDPSMTDPSGPTTPATTIDPATTVPSQPPAQPNWDDDANPHKFAAAQYAAQLARIQEQQDQFALQQEAQALKAQGLTDEQVNQTMQARWGQYQLNRERAQLQEQARPVVAQVLAQRISQQYGVDIKPEELLMTSTGTPVPSPEAMLARADALINERRSRAAEKRVATGADKVDNAGSGVVTLSEAQLKSMRPEQLLRLGITRGHHNR